MKLSVILFTLFRAANSHITQVQVPPFWWDIAEDASYISIAISPPQEQDVAYNDSKSRLWFWNFDWANGLSMEWTDGEGRWAAWLWNSTVLSGLRGAGFVYDISTEKGSGRAGVAWERSDGSIIWNCFRAGDLVSSLPWMSWHLGIKHDMLGFMKNGSRWGFMTGTDRVWSRHCNSAPSTGKRYQIQGGREVATNIKKDPSAVSYARERNRIRRSPDFQSMKDSVSRFWRNVRDFFTERNGQTDDDPQARKDENCDSFWNAFIKLLKWMFGVQDNGGAPGGGSPGEAPSGDNPDTTDLPANEETRRDTESMDTEQNEAVADWE